MQKRIYKRKYNAKVSKFIDAFWEKEFRSPVLSDIMEACGIPSKSVAWYVLRQVVQERGDKFRDEKYVRTSITPQWVISAIKKASKARSGRVARAGSRKLDGGSKTTRYPYHSPTKP